MAATFYLAAFYLRSSPAVMTTELMRDFGIGASQLGNFSAVYFYAYIAMQIPTGVLVDSWGARRLLIGGSLAAAAGTCLFGRDEQLRARVDRTADRRRRDRGRLGRHAQARHALVSARSGSRCCRASG